MINWFYVGGFRLPDDGDEESPRLSLLPFHNNQLPHAQPDPPGVIRLVADLCRPIPAWDPTRETRRAFRKRVADHLAAQEERAAELGWSTVPVKRSRSKTGPLEHFKWLAELNMLEYAAYYQRTYDEARHHHHKRALVLTARKLVRLVFAC